VTEIHREKEKTGLCSRGNVAEGSPSGGGRCQSGRLYRRGRSTLGVTEGVHGDSHSVIGFDQGPNSFIQLQKRGEKALWPKRRKNGKNQVPIRPGKGPTRTKRSYQYSAFIFHEE